MKKKWTCAGVAVVVIVALMARRQMVARYHAWQCGRAYEHVLAPDATPEQKTQYRALTVHHADQLVRLGRWQKKSFRIIPMPEEDTRIAFMQKALFLFPRDTGYFQIWGALGPGGPEARINVWCTREYMPEWRHFLVDSKVLIENVSRPATSTYPEPAKLSPQG